MEPSGTPHVIGGNFDFDSPTFMIKWVLASEEANIKDKVNLLVKMFVEHLE